MLDEQFCNLLRFSVTLPTTSTKHFGRAVIWLANKFAHKILHNGHLPTGATVFGPSRQSILHSYFNHSTSTTSPQRQWSLKLVSTAKIISWQWPMNQQKSPFYCNWSLKLIHALQHWSLCKGGLKVMQKKSLLILPARIWHKWFLVCHWDFFGHIRT